LIGEANYNDSKYTRLLYLYFSLCFSASTVTVSATANLLRLSPSVLPSSFSRTNPETSVDQLDPDPGMKKEEEKEEEKETEEEVIEMDVGKGEETEKEKKEMEVEVLEESFEEELDEELDEEELEAELEEAMKGLRREQGNKKPFSKFFRIQNPKNKKLIWRSNIIFLNELKVMQFGLYFFYPLVLYPID